MTILKVYPDRLTDESGKEIKKDWRFKATQSLSQAIDFVSTLDGKHKLLIDGDCSTNGQITIGSTQNPVGNKLSRLANTTFEGVNTESALPSFSVFQNQKSDGNAFLRLEIKALDANHCMLFGKNQPEVRDWSWYGCTFDGYSTKVGQAAWGLQVAGESEGFSVAQCTFTDFREHGTYWHNAANVLIVDTLFERCEYSGSQNMNRSWEGRPSYGSFVHRGSRFIDCGEQGAASLTNGGHTGDYIIDNVEIDTPHSTGGILCYWEGPKYGKGPGGSDLPGSHRDLETGFGISSLKLVGRSKVTMKGSSFYSTSFNDCGYVAIAPMQFIAHGNPAKPCIWLHRPNTGKPNGKVELGFTSGVDPVWNGAKYKVRQGNKDLSDAEIDAMAVLRSSSDAR